jgi:HK97 family phage prohead protease
VRALFNHDPNFILGRMLPGTLSLWTDPLGLRYSIKVPDTQAARDVLASIARGDVTGSSFSFLIHADGANYRKEGKQYIRELTSVQLFDIGPVTFPAYKSSTTGARMVEDPAQVRKELEAWEAAELEKQLTGYRATAIAAGHALE